MGSKIKTNWCNANLAIINCTVHGEIARNEALKWKEFQVYLQ